LASTDNGGLAIGSAAAVKWLVGAYGNDDFSFLNATLGTSAVNILLSNNNVGIGTVSPGNKLHVVDATSFANSIYGENTYVGTADGTGVFGRSENAPNYGRGVVGIGGYIGVLGETSGGADPNTEYGVFANSMGSAGTRVGIYASASGGAVNWAGLFDGAVDVQGKVISNYDYPDFNMHSQPYLQSTLPFPSMSIIGNGGTEGVVLGLDGPNALGVFDTTGSAFAAINASAFNVTSDRRVKNSIEDITSAQYETYLAQIRTIESATYFYNNEQRDNKHVGFIAQSLPKEVINVNKAAKPGMPENLLMYNLSDMMGLSVIGIKALDSKQTQMEQELKKEIADLRAEIQQLKNNK
jgi:hypothetical protein